MLALGQAWVRRGHGAADQLAGADRGRADAVRDLARAARRARDVAEGFVVAGVALALVATGAVRARRAWRAARRVSSSA